jgi:prepilin-type N-terminal cleavage/methylation domain-containing protein/prepilin-type processing-associated H-X9-DG protein
VKTHRSGFTLIELLVTISIIAMLATLLTPAIGRAIAKADSVRCANNLSQVGIAVMNYAADNDNRYPEIESMPTNPVYPSDSGAGTMLAVLGPYGITEAALRCPADVKLHNYFKKEGSSYMWRPTVDDELTTAPKIYTRRAGQIVPPASRLALATDFEGGTHHGHINAVFADGHVRMF